MKTETNQNVSRKIKNKSKQKNANYIDTKGHNLNKKNTHKYIKQCISII